MSKITKDSGQDLEAAARALEASGSYRVLRRLVPRPVLEPANGAETRSALFVDVETTGLDPAQDEIIELAMVPFTYGSDGRIFEVSEPFSGLREPRRPIPAEITALTGITDAMVAGKSIDPEEVAKFVQGASLIVAHNAVFDRRFLERLSPVFAGKPWACSMTQVDWASEGYEGVKLAYLAMGAGFFYERHRATQDCLAAIEVLAARLPKAGVPAMARLLETARRSTWRIWAENSPFDSKDRLKARGYRWNGDNPAHPRAWYIDVAESERDAELEFLRTEIFRREVELPTRKISALERFSDRV